MNEIETAEPGLLAQVGWFFRRWWNRVVCATRGHCPNAKYFCERCGLPIPTWDEINALQAELADERADRLAFHEHYLAN